MLTANSISGGRSSAYIAANYPSDIEIFALVCADDPQLAHPDKKLMQMANDRLYKYQNRWGEFIGTPEDPTILKTIFDLEQYIGREIIWTRGESFDSLIERKSMIPNKFQRFCTEEMKLRVIAEWFYLNTNLDPIPLETPRFSKERPFWCNNPVQMRVGYRYDEKERADKFTTEFEFAIQCALYGLKKQRNIILKNWREGDFVLIEERANSFTVGNFWRGRDVEFAEDSNCNNCFWKHVLQLQRNYKRRPALRRWVNKYEQKYKHTFHHEMSVEQIMRLPEQLSLDFTPGAYCQEGNCHD